MCHTMSNSKCQDIDQQLPHFQMHQHQCSQDALISSLGIWVMSFQALFHSLSFTLLNCVK